MNRARKPDEMILLTRKGFTFRWWGGEYAEITGPGSAGPFEVINMTLRDGSLPAFTEQVLLEQVLECDFSELRDTLAEHTRYPA